MGWKEQDSSQKFYSEKSLSKYNSFDPQIQLYVAIVLSGFVNIKDPDLGFQ